jgi:hypothetical protein
MSLNDPGDTILNSGPGIRKISPEFMQEKSEHKQYRRKAWRSWVIKHG